MTKKWVLTTQLCQPGKIHVSTLSRTPDFEVWRGQPNSDEQRLMVKLRQAINPDGYDYGTIHYSDYGNIIVSRDRGDTQYIEPCTLGKMVAKICPDPGEKFQAEQTEIVTDEWHTLNRIAGLPANSHQLIAMVEISSLHSSLCLALNMEKAREMNLESKVDTYLASQRHIGSQKSQLGR